MKTNSLKGNGSAALLFAVGGFLSLWVLLGIGAEFDGGIDVVYAWLSILLVAGAVLFGGQAEIKDIHADLVKAAEIDDEKLRETEGTVQIKIKDGKFAGLIMPEQEELVDSKPVKT